MSYRITILCENSVGSISGTLGEHGFSALVENSRGETLLFDTGQGLTLLHNARRMNKDLAAVRKVLLSHGHYDHTGGLLPLLRECGAKDVYGHPGIFLPRYRVKDTGDSISIGLPHDRISLEAAGAVFHLSDKFQEISTDVFMTGHIPRTASSATGDAGLYCDGDARQIDVIHDDQSLILRTGKGLVILLGCCHAGLANVIEHVTSTMDRQQVHAIIGGTHLGFCGQEELELAVDVIRKNRPQRLAVSHCTGFTAAARLHREFPAEFRMAGVGYTFEC